MPANPFDMLDDATETESPHTVGPYVVRRHAAASYLPTGRPSPFVWGVKDTRLRGQFENPRDEYLVRNLCEAAAHAERDARNAAEPKPDRFRVRFTGTDKAEVIRVSPADLNYESAHATLTEAKVAGRHALERRIQLLQQAVDRVCNTTLTLEDLLS